MRLFIVIYQTTFFLFSIGLHLGASPEQENKKKVVGPKLSAELLVYDDLKQTTRADKNATLRSENLLLQAQSIIWDRNSSLVIAKGEVILTTPGLRLLCESFSLDLKNGSYLAQQVRTGFSTIALEASSASQSDQGLQLENSEFNIGENGIGKWKPDLNFENLSYDSNQSLLTTSSGKIGIGYLPNLPLPDFKINLSKDKTTWNFKTKAGKKSNLGWYLGKEVEWEVEKIKTKAEIVGYLKRGVLLSSKLDYKKEEPWIRSFIDFGWLKDEGNNLGLDQRSMTLSKQRSYFETQLVYLRNSGLRIAGQNYYESDSEINRDLRLDDFSGGQWHDHTFEIGFEQNWGGISSLQRWQMNEHQGILERRPNLRVEMAPINPVEESLFHSATLEYSELKNRDAFGRTNAFSSKMDAAIKTFRPFHFPNGISYIPSFTFRNQNFKANHAEPKASWTEWSNELRLRLYGNYELSDQLWEIEDLQHSMEFVLSHNHLRLHSPRDLNLVPPLDSSDFRLNLEPFGLMEEIEADMLEPSEKIRLNWIQNLTTNFQEQYRNLARLKLSQDLWVIKDGTESREKSFYAQLELRPARWLELRGQTKTENSDFGKVGVYSALIRDGIFNEYQISKIDFPNSNQQWGLIASRLVDYGNKILFSIRYDSDAEIFPYWRVSYEHNGRNGLVYTINLSERNGTSKEDDIEISFGFRLFDF